MDSAGIDIRDFTEQDAGAVNRIAVAAFAQYAEAYDDWPGFSARIADLASMAGGAELIVAACNGQIRGAVAYLRPDRPKPAFLPADDASIRMLVVDPLHRGHGIGRKLTEECLHRARRDGSAGVSLHTSEIMSVALAMYLRLGFVEIPDITGFRICGVPYRIYRKTLTHGASARQP